MRRNLLKSHNLICIICITISALSLYFYWSHCFRYEYFEQGDYIHYDVKHDWRKSIIVTRTVDGQRREKYDYGPYSHLIFIGGFPRSGTTLMRVMLDAHPDVRCGEETRVVPRILGLRTQWKRSEKEKKRLEEAGVSDVVLDSAISSFILEVVAKHGPPAKRFCNKDPFALKSTEYLAHLFPNSKFVLMLRDGRAVIHSVISRKVTITGFNLSDYRSCLQKWNDAVSLMYHQCYLVGEKRCLPVYYEQLVLNPERWLREISRFLKLPWNDTMLHHETLIGKEIRLSKNEKSSDQVIKPVYKEALTNWVGHLPADVVRDMATIAPMLSQLGYDPQANPPNYQQALERHVTGDDDETAANKSNDLT